jgi:hypothetical protein
MDVLRLRTLTRKSTHKFGYEDNKDLTVQQLLDLKKHKVIITTYFGLDRINYIDDILDEVGITKDLRLDKPAKLRGKEQNEAVRKAVNNMYENKTEKEIMGASMAARKKSRDYSKKIFSDINRSNRKKSLQSKNHGN